MRNLLETSPEVRSFAESPLIQGIVEPVLGLGAFAVRTVIRQEAIGKLESGMALGLDRLCPAGNVKAHGILHSGQSPGIFSMRQLVVPHHHGFLIDLF
jgi:hypothetical protein